MKIRWPRTIHVVYYIETREPDRKLHIFEFICRLIARVFGFRFYEASRFGVSRK